MTTSPAAPPSGPIRVGRYTLLQRLGEGGMGVVHLARRDDDGHRVALKVLRPHVVGDQEARDRLAREVSSLALVHSPRVAEVLDADPWGPVPFVVTRYVPGPSLHEHVAAEGAITGADLEWTALCLAEALAAVHDAGVLHRDVKPTNVLMEGRSPVLIDFGLARVADDPRLTHTGWLLGTPGYLAPEILYGEDATAASDVHSWAATVAFAGLGRPPFGRGPAMAVMDRVRRGEHDLTGLPSPLREALRDSLHPDPGSRPTLGQLLGWLRERAGVPDPGRTVVRPVPTLVDPRRTVPTVPTVPSVPTASQAPRADRVPSAATRVLPVLDEDTYADRPGPDARTDAYSDLGHDGEDGAGPWEGWDQPLPAARVSLGRRLRAGSLLAVLAVLGGAGLAAYPWPTVAVLVAAVVLLRAGSRGGAVRDARRQVRGPRWWDAPLAVLGAPWHLVASLPGSLALLAWAGGCAVAGALLAYAFAPGATAVLAAAGLAGSAGVWLGPGGSRVRGPLRRAALPLAARTGSWLLVLAVLGGTALALGASATSQGTDWAPATDDPVTQLRDAVDGVAVLDRIRG